MQLESITIKNYRSIEELTFTISQFDDQSFTYGLIGVNEAGKSSILKALSLKDGLKNEKGEPLPLPKDFKDQGKPVEIEYLYALNSKEIEELGKYLIAQVPTIDDPAQLQISKIRFIVTFNYTAPTAAVLSAALEGSPIDDAQIQAIQEHLRAWVAERAHKSIFWTAEDRYLISQPINLDEFAAAPDNISVPLRNCFALSGIVGQPAIQAKITAASESTDREQLQNELGEKVTEHINSAWPEHRIKITFNISDGLINFHVYDLGSKGKAKTADQRSDGFGQFISFLLTISAQSKSDELSNTVILLDEPETHLHPQAQENLLQELIKITKSSHNNICFFATHSNYMIDKADLSRTQKVVKTVSGAGIEETKLDSFDKKKSSYASVTYEVFNIPTTDYHNELFAQLHENYQAADLNDQNREKILNFDTEFLNKVKNLPKDKPWRTNANQATLPTYIRNCIHHPDNGNKYTAAELKKSIDLMLSYL